MNICLSIAPTSTSEACQLLSLQSQKEYLVELRVDNISDLDLKTILSSARPKIIITNRLVKDGGKFSGTLADHLKILKSAIEFGAEYIDVEYHNGIDVVRQFISESGTTKVICSYHNLENTSTDIKSIYESIRKTRAPIIKIATMANDITDNKIIFDLLQTARRDEQKIIALCMGEYGEISRIIGSRFHNFLSFGCSSIESATAAGQINIDLLKNLYRANVINQKTKIFGLVGNPVKQSMGVFYHNNRFIKNDVNAVYVNYLVNDFKLFLESFVDLISGLSITMPFKKEAASLVDVIDNRSKHLGIINTIIKKKGKLHGTNTDLIAVMSLMKQKIRPHGKHIAVLGTGATAYTLAYSAIRGGAKITIAGRDITKAKSLATDLNCSWSTFEQLSDLRYDVLINATSVGMEGNKSEIIVQKNIFRKGMIAFDTIYNPVMTQFLQDALESGCEIITGMELFKKQALLQSKLFFKCFD